MKNIIVFYCLLLFSSCSVNTQRDAKSTSQFLFKFGPKLSVINSISKKELKHHLTFIASDSLKGRAIGTPEMETASNYLAAQLKSYGYKGLGKNNSFFQEVNLRKVNTDFKHVNFSYAGKSLNFKYGKDFVGYLWNTKLKTFKLPLYSVSSGYNTDSTNVYDVEKIKNHIPIYFDHYDTFAKTDSSLTMRHIRNLLFNEKAGLVIHVSDNKYRQKMNFEKYKISDVEGYLEFASETTESTFLDSSAYIVLTESAFNKILKIEKQSSFNKKIDYEFKSELEVTFNPIEEKINTRNVIAYIKGTDSTLSDEYVGIGAHYDHLGIGKDGKIFNGANDDGSGVVSVLSIAKAFAKNPPRRSTFIIFHTAEEGGLMGSKFFVNNSPIPLEKIISVTNMDMVGSNHDPEKIYIIGADRISQDLHNINEKINSKLNLIKLDYELNGRFHPERIYYRSDHYNYAKKEIPVIFYTDLDPDNYHKESDTVEKINFEKLLNVTKVAFSTSYYVANQPTRIKISYPINPKFHSDFAKKYIGEYKFDNGFSIFVKYKNEHLVVFDINSLSHVENHIFDQEGNKVEFSFGSDSTKAFSLDYSSHGTDINRAYRVK